MIPHCEQLVDHIAGQLRKHMDLAVVGLSGGADSSLVALLCREAIGKENVYGISMPFNQTDKDTFNSLSDQLADHIAIRHLVRHIAEIANAINDQAFFDAKDALSDTNKGNARSRARMCVLYGIAHDLAATHPDKRVRVIGTGNLSEDFIGYDTKGGDALADIFPIGDLFKSEVYQLLEYFRDRSDIPDELINRVPSAGLEDNQTDEDDLGHTYNEMEKGIRFCLEHYDQMNEQEPDAITAFVWQRHLAHKHKHEAPAVIRSRHLCM